MAWKIKICQFFRLTAYPMRREYKTDLNVSIKNGGQNNGLKNK